MEGGGGGPLFCGDDMVEEWRTLMSAVSLPLLSCLQKFKMAIERENDNFDASPKTNLSGIQGKAKLK